MFLGSFGKGIWDRSSSTLLSSVHDNRTFN